MCATPQVTVIMCHADSSIRLVTVTHVDPVTTDLCLLAQRAYVTLISLWRLQYCSRFIAGRPRQSIPQTPPQIPETPPEISIPTSLTVKKELNKLTPLNAFVTNFHGCGELFRWGGLELVVQNSCTRGQYLSILNTKRLAVWHSYICHSFG